MCCDDYIMYHGVECHHEWEKTLAQSGMFFIDMCHKCYDQRPFDMRAGINYNLSDKPAKPLLRQS
jgi:hypothetical protein